MSTADRPIGVFDSGVGGLSVLRALHAQLPLENFVYVADSGHAPYGERDDTHVLQRAFSITRYLRDVHAVKALVVACNTATAAAIRQLREAYPDLPIIGIEPALKPAVAQSKTGVIGVMATRGTIGSEKFRTLLSSLQGQATFHVQACDGLADAIEQALATKIIAISATCTGAMGRFGTKEGDIDTLVLGCTHYPFASAELQKLLGQDISLLEGGAPVARQTRRLLEQSALLHSEPKFTVRAASSTTYLSTGSKESLEFALQRWIHLEANVSAVDIR